MSELSTEVKAKETHENAMFYYGRAEFNLYKSTMEIKKIRDERYFKKLGYSNFDEYCRDCWDVGQRTMYERIEIANNFDEDDFLRYSAKLGHKKTLFLAQMDEPQRGKALNEGIPTDEGYKTIDKATQKEINDYKRDAEKAEEKARQAEQAKQQAESTAETERKERERLENELENQEPERVEVTKEVYPDDYKSNKEMLEFANRKNNKLQEELDALKMKETSDFDEEKAEKELQKLQWEAEKSVYRFINKVDDFMEEIAIFGYMDGEIASSNNTTKERLSESVEHLKNFTRKMETSLKGRIEI